MPLDLVWLLLGEGRRHQRAEEEWYRDEGGDAERPSPTLATPRKRAGNRVREVPAGLDFLGEIPAGFARVVHASCCASSTRDKNSRVRGSRGEVKICSGGPSSRIRPASRKQTLSATSRAKPISCV